MDKCSLRKSLCYDYGETLLLKFVIMAICDILIFNMNLLCMFNTCH